MNILPKKSWHVLSKKNIERVRRDEAEAKAKEEEKALRATIAEREARVELMRKRAREREGIVEEEEEEKVREKEKDRAESKGRHINFFADVEQGVGLQLANAEHEAEKKAEQEKVEKRIGLLNYLVDKDKDSDPWYVRKRKAEDSVKSEQRKERMDPLKDMKHYVATKKKCLKMEEEAPLHVKVHSHSHREEQRCHKDHKHKHKSKKSDTLEELRRERRRREEAERAKAEALVRRHYGAEPTVSSGPQAVEEIAGRYNSQFNPHLARH